MSDDIRKAVGEAIRFLVSRVHNGVISESFGLRRGPSDVWTTACVGSALSEVHFTLAVTIGWLLGQQHENGGWGYNSSIPPDCDTTLRVMELLRKLGLNDHPAWYKAERFVWKHQQTDGGFATYLSQDCQAMGYPQHGGWASSHADVTALATREIRNLSAINQAVSFLERHRNAHGLGSYWWKGPYYLGHLLNAMPDEKPDQTDTIELSLALLVSMEKFKSELANEYARALLKLQKTSGAFIPGKQLRIPRPDRKMAAIDGTEEIVVEEKGVFSTAAAMIALHRYAKWR